jgi:hypothetical protein
MKHAKYAMTQDYFVTPAKAGVQGVLYDVRPGFPLSRE